MAIKLKTNKAVPISQIPNGTISDAYAKIGALKLEDDGSLTYSIHYYASQETMDNDFQVVSVETHNMDIPNLENQIKANMLSKGNLDQATDV